MKRQKAIFVTRMDTLCPPQYIYLFCNLFIILFYFIYFWIFDIVGSIIWDMGGLGAPEALTFNESKSQWNTSDPPQILDEIYGPPPPAPAPTAFYFQPPAPQNITKKLFRPPDPRNIRI